MENARIANLLDRIADLPAITPTNQFRIRSYRSAAQTVRSQTRSLQDMAENGDNPSGLPRIGKSTADKIRECNEFLRGIGLLAGVEVDVLEDGRLDLGEKLLSGLDWVIASIHSHFRLSEKRMTDRLLRAIRSAVVHCLGHPLGRMIGKREPIAVDIDKLLEACREHGVLLEINGQPDRPDLPDTYCKRAREPGLKFTINTDAHSPSDFDLMKFGVTVARRGWLEKKDVLNTGTLKTLRRKIARK